MEKELPPLMSSKEKQTAEVVASNPAKVALGLTILSFLLKWLMKASM